jgi:redox-sensitive bicupin YhaK (pirin superfamily)
MLPAVPPVPHGSLESLEGRRTRLGPLEILRLLPRRQRRTVGPWCFLDRYGPLSFGSSKPMDVGPHPHIGLQTVSWLVEGEIVHNDSLGFEAVMHPGQLNLMTAGEGIAHSEETPPKNSGNLSGVQLWIALPEAYRNLPPLFDHYAALPELEFGGGNATLILGELAGRTSPARTFWPAVGADIALHGGKPAVLPLDPQFEHALVVLRGNAALEGLALDSARLHYLAAGRGELALTGEAGARVLLIGGRPFEEPLLMWWNFVARTHAEIAQARSDWIARRRFGDVKGYAGRRTGAPELAPLPTGPTGKVGAEAEG